MTAAQYHKLHADLAMTSQDHTHYHLLFICMGNICRSPTAEGVFRQLARESGLAQHLVIDSAGTHNYHPGSPPDQRSQQHAALRGYDLSDLRARQINDQDFEKFDLLLVMDWDNLALTEQLCPPEQVSKIRRLTEFCLKHDAAVIPDPYDGGAAGFDHVLDLVEDASRGLLMHVEQNLQNKKR